MNDVVENTNDSKEQFDRKTFADESYVGSKYSYYVLTVLLLVYIFNFVDRQILSILAEDIKADLLITDAELGILYGTVFAVFYALFGIPLGRLADVWMRKSLIATGLFVWSIFTALSGTARSFYALAGYRVGVGVGEASASPAAFSMLSDYFLPKQRATAMAVYSSGVYIGGGIGIAIGGVVLESWHHAFPDPSLAPLGLKGWQFAFMLVGLPGVLMSLWVRTLKEPIRGMSEGVTPHVEPRPFALAFDELMGILPLCNIFTLKKRGASIKVMMINLVVAVILGALGWWLFQWLGSAIQWIALGIGIHSAFTWCQSLALKSPEMFEIMFKSKTLILICIAFPCIGFVGYGGNFFSVPYLLRQHDVSHAEIGTVIGLSAAVAAWLGVSFGGILADKMRQKFEHGRLVVAFVSMILAVPCGFSVLFAKDMTTVYIFNFLYMFFSPMYIGPATSTVNDLVLPHMRATVSALYLMMMTFIGLALGPYVMGATSALIEAGGTDSATALREGILWGYVMLIVAGVLILAACKTIKGDHARIKEIAAAQST
ncbi:MAG: spinster family MFS transporter [Cellvibrionaceae bacterium]